ncbi:redoxin family protein [Pseudomonadota bacterium]|nr:redoxin family protein [Alphaproteobacteria bacterium]MDC0457418.1 redoxin family protein [Alphaproteobacteria bacterium]MDC1357113.1 redoxin family protein [Pseudomonadota bacterium]
MTSNIVPGKKTPALVLNTLDNDKWSLGSNLNKTKTMVVFYRGLHCPICSEFLKLIDNQLSDYKKSNTEVIAVSMDNKEKALKAKDEWSLHNLKIAYDLSEEKAREWNLYISSSIKEAESDVFCEPGLFIIKEDGSLYLVNTSNMPFARPDISSLPAKLVFADEKQYPVRGNK